MISLTALRGTPIVLNALLIEAVRATPDTTIQLVGGQTYVVRETIEQVQEAKIAFYQPIGMNRMNAGRRQEDGGREKEE